MRRLVTDEALMEQAQQNDKKAYEELVVRHRLGAIRFAASIVKQAETAEDIVQDCFVKIYFGRMVYKPKNSFRAYLYTILRNQCIDHIRRTSLRKQVDFEDYKEILQDVELPEELLLQEERMQMLYSALHTLPENQKTALYLFAVAGMSYQEIARVLRVTQPQVKNYIYKGRQTLKLRGLAGSEWPCKEGNSK